MPVTEALKRLLTSFGLQDYCGVFTELVSNQSFDVFVLHTHLASIARLVPGSLWRSIGIRIDPGPGNYWRAWRIGTELCI